jgi:hypothetical protein
MKELLKVVFSGLQQRRVRWRLIVSMYEAQEPSRRDCLPLEANTRRLVKAVTEHAHVCVHLYARTHVHAFVHGGMCAHVPIKWIYEVSSRVVSV